MRMIQCATMICCRRDGDREWRAVKTFMQFFLRSHSARGEEGTMEPALRV